MVFSATSAHVLLLIKHIIHHHTGGWQTSVTLVVLSHPYYHLDTDHIVFVHSHAPQFHGVDPHNPIFPRVRENNTIFHAETAVNHLPTGRCVSS